MSALIDQLYFLQGAHRGPCQKLGLISQVRAQENLLTWLPWRVCSVLVGFGSCIPNVRAACLALPQVRVVQWKKIQMETQTGVSELSPAVKLTLKKKFNFDLNFSICTTVVHQLLKFFDTCRIYQRLVWYLNFCIQSFNHCGLRNYFSFLPYNIWSSGELCISENRGPYSTSFRPRHTPTTLFFEWIPSPPALAPE